MRYSWSASQLLTQPQVVLSSDNLFNLILNSPTRYWMLRNGRTRNPSRRLPVYQMFPNSHQHNRLRKPILATLLVLQLRPPGTHFILRRSSPDKGKRLLPRQHFQVSYLPASTLVHLLKPLKLSLPLSDPKSRTTRGICNLTNLEDRQLASPPCKLEVVDSPLSLSNRALQSHYHPFASMTPRLNQKAALEIRFLLP